MTLGKNYTAGTPCSLDMRGHARLTVHGQGRVSIARGVRILILENAHLEIGHESVINFDTAITCFEHISIGSRVAISWNANVFDGNMHELIVNGVSRPRTKPVQIGDHAWIGTGATILGAVIGEEAVVGAASMVTSDVPARALAAGNPARIISKEVSWRV
jgi:acetyltransferase-like isoleucine patch superfamily enzyme